MVRNGTKVVRKLYHECKHADCKLRTKKNKRLITLTLDILGESSPIANTADSSCKVAHAGNSESCMYYIILTSLPYTMGWHSLTVVTAETYFSTAFFSTSTAQSLKSCDTALVSHDKRTCCRRESVRVWLALLRSNDTGVWSASRERTFDNEGGVVPEVREHMLVSVKS